jgi:hypothetical protein
MAMPISSTLMVIKSVILSWSATLIRFRLIGGFNKPSWHANNKQTTTMKQAFPLPHRAEIDSAFVAVYRSDIPHREKQILLVMIERAKREADRKLAKLSK